jgi:hypothetical protein
MTKSTLYALTGVSQCQSSIVVTTRIIDDSITILPLHARSPSFVRVPHVCAFVFSIKFSFAQMKLF